MIHFDSYKESNPNQGRTHYYKIVVKLNKNSAISGEFKFSVGEIRNRTLVLKKIQRKLRLHDYEPEDLRLFNRQGLELFEQDMRFINDKDLLYVSRGEDFDILTYISEYEKVKDLGSGGYGSVILGIHKKDKSKVAIKITNADSVDSTKDVDLIFAESEILKGLKHKNIVEIYNYFLIKKSLQAYFIMEFLEGGELLHYIANKGHLSETESLHIFKQLVGAIDYCHRQKIIHRDLKLENILRVSNTSDQFKIVDFGIAGLCSGKMSVQTEAGSLNYLPPEILTQRNVSASPALDVWAMGCILFAMLNGRIPFNGKNEKETKKFILEEEPIFESDLEFSKEVRNLLSKMLHKKFEKRICVYDILNHPWVKGKKLEKEKTIKLEAINEIVEVEEEEVEKIAKVRFGEVSKFGSNSKAKKKSAKKRKRKSVLKFSKKNSKYRNKPAETKFLYTHKKSKVVKP